jgi:hypothetical protein
MINRELPAGLPAGTTFEELLTLVEKLRRIPDSVRRFDASPGWAWERMRMRPELLAFLTDMGLPCCPTPDGIRYDRYDLGNCGMQLGHGPLARSARRFWPTALGRVDSGVRARYEMRYQMRCPEPGHVGVCRYELMLPGGELITRETTGGAMPDVSVEITPRIDWPELPKSMWSPLAATAGLNLMFLREEIRRDLDFVRTSRLADCAGSAIFIAEEARLRDLPARASYGLVVAPPFGVEHYWTEFLVEGVWVPVDPVLIRQTVLWGVLDGDRWPPHRSIGPLVARVSDVGVPLVRHNGKSIPSTLPIRLLPDRDGRP